MWNNLTGPRHSLYSVFSLHLGMGVKTGSQLEGTSDS